MAQPIGVIAPYPELADVIRQVLKDLDLQVDIAVGDLHFGLEAARRMVASGTEVLVSRGGTAMLLARLLSVPVVEIRVNAFDLLRSLNSLPAGFSGHVRMIGFPNVIHSTPLLGQLLRFNISSALITAGAGPQVVLADAVREQVDVVLGDAVTVRLAREMGICGLLITSGHEAVHEALGEASRLLGALRAEKQRAAQLKAILDSSHDAVVAVGSDGRVAAFNRGAAQLFGVSQEASVLGRPASEVLPGAVATALLPGSESIQGQVQRVGNTTVLINKVKIEAEDADDGFVATLRDVSELQTAEQKVRRAMHASGLTARHHLQDLTSVSEAMRRTIDMARRYALSDSTILIHGETGVGKEMFAQGIHNAGSHRDGPFVAVNCAAIPESLLESELFGYADGAFTGASKGGRPGLFELAHRGTIFLDEIGEMQLPLQSRLLRVLQEREVMRIGGDRVLPVKIRVIAATNLSLEEEVAAGRFRIDLFYRLNVLRLTIPPLRERPDDVEPLLRLFLERMAARRNQTPVAVSPRLLVALQAYHWPGNTRELIGVAERIDLLSAGGRMDAAAELELLSALAPPGSTPPLATADRSTASGGLAIDGTLAEITMRVIASVLEQERGNMSRAALRLGIDRTTVWRHRRRSAGAQDT